MELPGETGEGAMKKIVGIIDRCLVCPFRFADPDVGDGTGDICKKKHRGFNYLAYSKKGEFPKFCPLKEPR